ncbi:gliding motility-associated C-terminal domain-containing protein [Pedobacter namyangjuensis]|uniref:gliding motility-associated C-terminal domain-containing protein n=1 Tax=Pedobacter namyangjuensis TaxID=600626 RepID=UPI000DE44F25|nr:gliding motility-associated C-terminal domain-containing protein [Pedobacter namyangjuensis]
MKRFYKLFSLFVIFIFFQTEINAQVCTGALGDPVINIDFGRGSNQFGPPLLSNQTDYIYNAGTPNAGQYVITKNTFGMHNSERGWHQIINRTPNDTDGYMMVIDAALNPGVFYQTSINNLCPKTTYEFAAWINNILNYSGIKPNVTFLIETNDGILLSKYDTNDILESTVSTWKRYSTTFTTSNETDIVLKIVNNGSGQNGNDLAIDDITFSACGPEIISSINNVGTKADLCSGESETYVLKANVGTGYENPVYQWQENKNGVWTNLDGETSTQTTRTFLNATAGLYQYRLNVAERENIGSPLCGVFSAVLTIRVTQQPNAAATSNSPVCFDGQIRLLTNNINLLPGDDVTYKWTGPNFSSADRDPIISNANLVHEGTYFLTVKINGCTSTTQTEVKVTPKVIASTTFNDITICEGDVIRLEASGGDTFKWLPSENLNDPNTATPIASPKKTTTYSVTVGVGACLDTKNITVTVNPKTTGNAGADRRILAGQSVQLDGTATGSNAKFSWSPTDYLDDPTILNPIATPPADITYTLTISSDCNTVTDDVFIRVFPKVDIANTFTPNGDGVNDTWIIPAIERFEKIKLEVMTRYGEKVFEANSFKSWDGKFKGNDLPVGTYFYILYLGDTAQKFSGWVLLTR